MIVNCDTYGFERVDGKGKGKGSGRGCGDGNGGCGSEGSCLCPGTLHLGDNLLRSFSAYEANGRGDQFGNNE